MCKNCSAVHIFLDIISNIRGPDCELDIEKTTEKNTYRKTNLKSCVIIDFFYFVGFPVKESIRVFHCSIILSAKDPFPLAFPYGIYQKLYMA